MYFSFGLIALIGIGFPIAGYVFLKDNTNVNWTLFSIAAFVMLNIGIGIIFQLKRKNIKTVFYLTIGFIISVFVFVLPLSKGIQKDAYKSISELKTKSKTENIKIYSFGDIAP